MSPLTPPVDAPDRNLALELVRVTEAAAMAAGRWVGRGDKNGADGVAVNAMRVLISTVGMNGVVVIGEGEEFRCFGPGAVTVSLARPEGSARNVWHGAVLSAAPHGDAVRLLVDAGPQLIADVTPAATRELGLEPGRKVWLSVKETAVDTYSVAPERPGKVRP